MNTGVVLCEGYFDRAFWAGWLLRCGCQDPPPSARRRAPDGTQSGPGHFWFRGKSDCVIWVVPCGTKENVLREARLRLRQRTTHPMSRLVLCIDPDTVVGGADAKTGLRVADVERMVREHDAAAKPDENGDIALGDGTLVSLIRWETAEAAPAGVPAKQCLERLVCAALAAIYPDRAPAVQTWLDNRPDRPASSPKEFSWSYMAGWYAEHGCEHFFRAVWEDEKVAVELEKRLRACGAWRVAEALVG